MNTKKRVLSAGLTLWLLPCFWPACGQSGSDTKKPTHQPFSGNPTTFNYFY